MPTGSSVIILNLDLETDSEGLSNIVLESEFETAGAEWWDISFGSQFW